MSDGEEDSKKAAEKPRFDWQMWLAIVSYLIPSGVIFATISAQVAALLAPSTITASADIVEFETANKRTKFVQITITNNSNEKQFANVQLNGGNTGTYRTSAMAEENIGNQGEFATVELKSSKFRVFDKIDPKTTVWVKLWGDETLGDPTEVTSGAGSFPVKVNRFRFNDHSWQTTLLISVMVIVFMLFGFAWITIWYNRRTQAILMHALEAKTNHDP